MKMRVLLLTCYCLISGILQANTPLSSPELPFFNEKITIIGGTGAVGSYFAMQLADAGYKVSIVGRPYSPHLERIQKSGLAIKTSAGSKLVFPSQFSYIGSFNPTLSKQDIIIVALKQPDLNEELARQIKQLSHKHTLLAFAANGIPFYFFEGLTLPHKDHIESVDKGGKIIQLLQDLPIVTLQPFIAAHITSPGTIQITRPLEKIFVALSSPRDDKASKNSVTKLADIFRASGIQNKVLSEKAHQNILEKLQFALSVNVLSALMNQSIDQVFSEPETQPFIKYSIALIQEISNSLHIGQLRNYDEFKNLPITKGHYSSLYKDIQDGKPTEISAIIEATLEIAHFTQKHPLSATLELAPLELGLKLLKQKATGHPINPADIKTLNEGCTQALAKMLPKQPKTNKISFR